MRRLSLFRLVIILTVGARALGRLRWRRRKPANITFFLTNDRHRPAIGFGTGNSRSGAIGRVGIRGPVVRKRNRSVFQVHTRACGPGV